MKKNILVGCLLASLFVPVIAQAADNQQQTPQQQELERQKALQKKKSQQAPPAQNQQPQNHPPQNQQPQNHPPQNQQPQNHPSQNQQPQNHPSQNQQPQNHPTQYQPPLNHPPHQHGEYHPQEHNHPLDYQHHTYEQLHSRQETVRQHWLNWREFHPNEQPSLFTLTVGERPYYLDKVHPGAWYYKNEAVDFIVPRGYVVISQDQAWYPGDSVDSQEFVLYTDKAYAAIDQEN